MGSASRRFREALRMLLAVVLLAENGMTAPRDKGDLWARSGPAVMRRTLVKRAVPLLPSTDSPAAPSAASLAPSTNTSMTSPQGESDATITIAPPTLTVASEVTAPSTQTGAETPTKTATEETKGPTTHQGTMNETMMMVTEVSTSTSASGSTMEEQRITTVPVVATKSPTTTSVVSTQGTNASATSDHAATSVSVGPRSTTAVVSSVSSVFFPNLPQMPHPISPMPPDEIFGRIGVVSTPKNPVGSLNLPTLAQPIKPSPFYV
ncbi:unnamed protein product [Ixodes persulcatus]